MVDLPKTGNQDRGKKKTKKFKKKNVEKIHNDQTQ